MPPSSGFKCVSSGTGLVARKMIVRPTGGTEEIRVDGTVRSSETTVSTSPQNLHNTFLLPLFFCVGLHPAELDLPNGKPESPLLLRSTFTYHARISKIRTSRSILSTSACLISYRLLVWKIFRFLLSVFCSEEISRQLQTLRFTALV
jgi:hypothetical protein